MKRINVAKTRLEKTVQRWINSETKNGGYEKVEDVLRDLFEGGCQSGMVGYLIYYSDAIKFYKKYEQEIGSLLKEIRIGTGSDIPELFGDKWDENDPLAREASNQTLLAWFGFEETARHLAEKANIEI